MLMTQQDEKLTSLWTISPACHTPNMPSMPHTKYHTLYSYWTWTLFSLSHPPLSFPDLCKPFPVLFRDRTLVQVWARAPPCAGHRVKASSYGNLPPLSTEPIPWIHPEHTPGIMRSHKTRFQFLRRQSTKPTPNIQRRGEHTCLKEHKRGRICFCLQGLIPVNSH